MENITMVYDKAFSPVIIFHALISMAAHPLIKPKN